MIEVNEPDGSALANSGMALAPLSALPSALSR